MSLIFERTEVKFFAPCSLLFVLCSLLLLLTLVFCFLFFFLSGFSFFLETENQIVKDDILTKQKLIDSLLQHNNLLITQQERLTTELLTPTSKNNCKARNKDVMQTENNNRQEEIPAKPGMSKANKLPLKKNPSRVIQPIETKNRY